MCTPERANWVFLYLRVGVPLVGLITISNVHRRDPPILPAIRAEGCHDQDDGKLPLVQIGVSYGERATVSAERRPSSEGTSLDKDGGLFLYEWGGGGSRSDTLTNRDLGLRKIVVLSAILSPWPSVWCD